MGQVSLIKRHAVYSAQQSGPMGGEVWLQKKNLKFSDLVVPASCRPQDQGTPACSLTGGYQELVGKSKFVLEIRGLRKFFVSLPLLPTKKAICGICRWGKTVRKGTGPCLSTESLGFGYRRRASGAKQERANQKGSNTSQSNHSNPGPGQPRSPVSTWPPNIYKSFASKGTTRL